MKLITKTADENGLVVIGKQYAGESLTIQEVKQAAEDVPLILSEGEQHNVDGRGRINLGNSRSNEEVKLAIVE